MSAPERVWATGDTKSGGWQAKTYNSLTCKPAQEYVRADIAATEADALRKSLHAAAKALDAACRAIADAGEALGEYGPSNQEAAAFLAAQDACAALAEPKP